MGKAENMSVQRDNFPVVSFPRRLRDPLKSELAELVEAARDNDPRSWEQLVERFSKLVWSVTRRYRLAPQDAADVSQTTWLQLANSLGSIRDPDRLGLWLVTVTRRECLRVRERNSRQTPVDPLTVRDVAPGDSVAVDERLLDDERRQLAWAALDRLPARCQRLLLELLAEPEPSYAQVAAALDMPIGSIGPQRQRCLANLRRFAAQELGWPAMARSA
jgi:RNA polymerase sigma factor (sigma-70 family)